jgi:hypothetical protein
MKIIITNKQYNTLVENITKTSQIDEGIGALVKSMVGRLSKKKSLSKKPIDVSVRNVFTRDLDAEIMKRDKQFPNNINELDFQNTLLRIKSVYEKIRLNSYLPLDDPEYLPVDDANWAIDTLIKYIYQIQQSNLKPVYRSRGKKLLKLANDMKWVKDTEVPAHKPKSKPKSVPRGTSPKATPPKPKPAPQPTINKGDMMWYNNNKVIVIDPNFSGSTLVRDDGKNTPFLVLTKDLKPI